MALSCRMAVRLHNSKSKCVTDGEHARGGDTRCDAEGTSLGHLTHTKDHVAVFAEGGVAVAGNCNQFNFKLLYEIYQACHFVGFSAVT